MSALIVAAVQMRSGRSAPANIAAAEALVREAAGRGATYVQTPEMTNLLARSREELMAAVASEADDPAVARFSALAAALGIHLHVGSLALAAGDGRAVNRALLFGPDGRIAARYDKIHMFDADLATERWRESASYAPGRAAVTAALPGLRLGFSICFDLRFPGLYRALARAGAGLLAVPAAFTAETGAAHWHVLLRARAIENGAFVVAAAQGGRHEDGRATYGHALVVDPWGRVLAEKDDDEPGVIVAELDPQAVADARRRLPVLALDRGFTGPDAA